MSSNLSSALLWCAMSRLGVDSTAYTEFSKIMDKHISLVRAYTLRTQEDDYKEDDEDSEEQRYQIFSSSIRLPYPQAELLEKLAPFLTEEDWLMNDAAMVEFLLSNDGSIVEDTLKRILVDNEARLMCFPALMKYKLPETNNLFGIIYNPPLKSALIGANLYFDSIAH